MFQPLPCNRLCPCSSSSCNLFVCRTVVSHAWCAYRSESPIQSCAARCVLSPCQVVPVGLGPAVAQRNRRFFTTAFISVSIMKFILSTVRVLSMYTVRPTSRRSTLQLFTRLRFAERLKLAFSGLGNASDWITNKTQQTLLTLLLERIIHPHKMFKIY